MGTASTLFYSSAGDATDWSTSDPSDSSSFEIPGEGKLRAIFKANNRVISCKDNKEVKREYN